MEPGRWGRITDIYHATIARPPEERASFLGEKCHGDASLRKQVEAMVKSHERSGDFIESPAFAVAPELLIDEPTGDLIGHRSVITGSSHSSASVEWAKFISRETIGSGVRLRSSFSQSI